MEFFTYLLSLIIVYGGLFIGLILAKASKEELRAGKKYFFLVQNVFLILIGIFFLIFLFIDNLLLLIITLFFAIFLFILRFYKTKSIYRSFVNDNIAYIIFGFLVFFIKSNITHYFAISSLILIYGLPTGSLIYYEKKEIFKKTIVKGLFVIIGLVLFFLL